MIEVTNNSNRLIAMNDLIQKYHTPDQRWNLWNANNYEEFIKTFMVIGKFHDKVPPVIKDEYKIVERLICYSYYHYPLLDEAFSKATRIFESAIKNRLDELGIPVKGLVTLEKKIKKIEPFTSSAVFDEWNKARKIRNYFAHPEAGKYLGITVARGFYQMVNILNLIFLDKKEIEENEHLGDQLKEKAIHFKQGLFILHFGDKKILIWSFIPYSFFRTKNAEKSFWVFHPVLTYFPQTIEKLNFSLPLYLNLKNLNISTDHFEATILGSGQKIIITPTNNPLDINQLIKHNEIILSSEYKVKEIFWHLLETEMSFELTKFLYSECWE
jgi:hypothetical protein